jgi:hypothetical protein
MGPAAILREQFREAHRWLDLTIEGVTPEQLHWAPPGTANPIGATYAHIVLGEDLMVNGMVRGAPPLFAAGWNNRLGLSTPPPMPNEGDWDTWARKVEVDLPALRAYAAAVFTATDDYLGSVTDADLERTCDLSAFDMPSQTVAWFLGNVAVPHITSHCGEIACLKGIQGTRGYPF